MPLVLPPPSPYYAYLSLYEHVVVRFKLLALNIYLIFVSLAYPLSSTTYSFKRTLWFNFVRFICPGTSVRQLQWICPNTTAGYQKFIREWSKSDPSCEIASDALKDGGFVHWIGQKRGAHRVILYFHGGGYVLPALPGHFGLVRHLQTEVSSRTNKTVVVALLEYSLVNASPWPMQLVQARHALEHVLQSGYLPSQILFGGDSAGGHIALALTSHLLHPHPAVPRGPTLSEPLAGAFMISPWTTFANTSMSFTRNGSTDLLPTYCLDDWGTLFVQARARVMTADEQTADSYYFEPHLASKGWWAKLLTVTRAVLVTLSKGECMYDDCIETCSTLKDAVGHDPACQVFIQQLPSIHNEPLADFSSEDKPGLTTQHISQWLEKRCS